MKKISNILIGLLLVMLSFSFNSVAFAATTPLKSVQANITQLVIPLNCSINISKNISVSGIYNNGSKSDITYLNTVKWSISNTSKAILPHDGTIRGLQEGSTTLNIEYNGKSTNINLVVKKININFNCENPNVVSQYTLNIIKQLLGNSGLSSATITSTMRTPAQQVEAMYNNCQSNVEKQLGIYGSAGDKVIRVYINDKKLKKSKSQIINNMKNKILEVGPTNISRHCAETSEYNKLNVIDIAQSSIKDKSSFYKELKLAEKKGILKKVLDENGCYHIEIYQ